MRAAGQQEHADVDALGQRTEGAVTSEAEIVTSGRSARTVHRPGGAVVTTKRSGVVTTATRQ